MDPLATKRVHMLARVAFVWAALIAARLIQLQVVQHPSTPRWRAISSSEW
jgi:cell division protein FtsI/penicillin-binding protein 2